MRKYRVIQVRRALNHKKNPGYNKEPCIIWESTELWEQTVTNHESDLTLLQQPKRQSKLAIALRSATGVEEYLIPGQKRSVSSLQNKAKLKTA